MPQVPIYSNAQVEERALPGVRQSSVASPGLFEGNAGQVQQVGQGLGNLGSAVGDIARQMQERENADMIFRAETALKDDYLKFEQQTRQRKGVSAWGVLPDTEKFFADQGKTHSEMLQNDTQRRLFGQTLTRMRQSAMGAAAEYESGERRRSVEESAKSSITSSINLAAANAANMAPTPGKTTMTKDENGNDVPVVEVGRDPIMGVKKDILNRVQVMSDLNGWTPERREAEEQTHLTNLHKQVIQNLVDKNPAGARAYFNANKAEINGSEYDSIDKVLKMGGLRETAQNFTDQAMASGSSQANALVEARKKYSGEEEVAVVQEIHARYGEVTQLREQGQKTAADQAWKVYAQTGQMPSSALLASMDGRDVEALRTHALNKAAGVGVKTDPSIYYELRQQMRDDPQGFRKTDLRKLINYLSPSDFQEFAKLQTADEGTHLDAVSEQQQLAQVHNQMKWGSGDKAKMGAFDKAATDAIRAEQVRTGKKLNQDQRQQVIDKMLIQGEVDGSGWFSDNKTFFEVSGTASAAQFVPKIGKADKQAIVDGYTKRNGRAPNDAQIMEIFKKWKGL